LPPVHLLNFHPHDRITARDTATIEEQIVTIEETLLNFGIPARVVDYQHGPTLTRFEVELDPGIRVSKVTQLQRELAMALAAGGSLRIEAPIPSKRTVGIEVPNRDRRIVSLRSVIECAEFQEHPSLLAVALGKDVAGSPVIVDLEPMPHLLVAGQTGSGKSVCLHTIILSLVMRATPDQLRLVIIDPKHVEMTRYDAIPHLFCPVVYTLRESADILRKCIREMQRRYDKFAVAGVSNIREYNAEIAEGETGNGLDCEPLPHIVVIIDELADLMTRARAEFEQSICQLARLARATGIHIVAATQRPSVNVITGHIKANFAARIALRLPASHDSRTILDSVGADKLLGNGDMLLLTSELSKPVRVQGAYVDRPDAERVARFLQEQGEPEFVIVPDFVAGEEESGEASEDVEVGDELFASAVRYVVTEQEASVSMLQRRFKIGYARAGRLIDLMERRGIVGPHEGSRPRRVLVGAHNVDQVLAGVGSASGDEIAAQHASGEEEPQASTSSPR
jgi:S-DNA-T family DNA segregation ATPase FtsK/SpoIIIE